MFLYKINSINTNRYKKKLYTFNFNNINLKKINIYKCIHNKFINRHSNIKYFSRNLVFLYNKNKLFTKLKNVYILNSIFFNKNKNNYIGFFKDINGFLFCNILNNNFSVGDFYYNNMFSKYFFYGYSFILLLLNNLNIVFNIINNFFISTTAGVFSTLLRIDYFNKLCLISLSSNINYSINYLTTAQLGRVSNFYFNKFKFGSAGTKLLYKKKLITVRGCCKNPVDHHNGGNTRGKKNFFSFWGKLAKSSK